MSINELPYLGALHLQVVLEELFIRLISSEFGVQARANFITSSGKRSTNEEFVPMAILITNGVGKGSLGILTILCCSDQAKVEPSVTLLTLVHQESPELAVVVMKMFTNLPYFPWGSFGLPFLDIATLTMGTSTYWFPLSPLHLCWLLLYSPTEVIWPKDAL